MRRNLAMLDEEREAFGRAYQGGGWLCVWPDGTRPLPDSVTDGFNRLVDLISDELSGRHEGTAHRHLAERE